MDPDPDPRKEIEVDPDLDPERGLKWIRIRPNAVDLGGSGSGSETLDITVYLYPEVILDENISWSDIKTVDTSTSSSGYVVCPCVVDCLKFVSHYHKRASKLPYKRSGRSGCML